MVKKYKPVRLSPSAIITYLKCPRDFYYRYIKRLPTPKTPALIKGSVIHKTLEQFFRKKYVPELEEYMNELFQSAWENYQEEWDGLSLTPDQLEKEKQDCKNQIDLFITAFLLKIKGLVDAEKAENERHAFFLLRPQFKELWIEDKELELAGYIDRVHTDFNGITTIGDYKTGSRFGLGNSEDYDLQCGLYALLYKKATGKVPDWVSIIYIRYGEEVRTRVTPYLIKWALEKVQYVRERTLTDNIEDYPCSQGKLCSYSPFFNEKAGICDVEDKIRQEKAIKELKKRRKK